ncbi:tryptophan synthase subunit alpha [Candidatus Poribacteria bacterium]|nr:tryptophan synthase subunit alpha [Candidatus Poribacteria bacterium]
MSANRIKRLFDRLRAEGSCAFMPYIAAGDPSLSVTRELLAAFEDAGADMVELGVPFSDPIADGPSVERATGRALGAGTRLKAILGLVEDVRRTSELPIALMGYYNPFFRYGVERFCRDAASAGVDGLIIPDLPPEDADELIPPARENGIATVFLVAPTSTQERLATVAAAATGFIYLVSVTGVTGARETVSADVSPLVNRLREVTDKPVCVGFGISTPEQASSVAALADGVIVGSAIVNTIERYLDAPAEIVPRTQAFVRSLVEAVRSVRRG